MLKIISDRIIKNLCESGLITKDSIDIYQFGLEATLLKFIHVTTMMIIGVCLDMVPETATFIVSYSILRIYAGGFHTKSKLRCYWISWLMIISVLILVKFCPAQIISAVTIGISIPSFLVIFIMAPVENSNKPLDDIEIYHYRKIARIILIAESSVSVMFLSVNIIQIPFVVSLSLFLLAIMLILGKIKIYITR
jgi:accessory gene regulator B